MDGPQAAGLNPVSPRERDVLAASADGSTISDIAGRLHRSEGAGSQIQARVSASR